MLTHISYFQFSINGEGNINLVLLNPEPCPAHVNQHQYCVVCLYSLLMNSQDALTFVSSDITRKVPAAYIRHLDLTSEYQAKGISHNLYQNCLTNLSMNTLHLKGATTNTVHITVTTKTKENCVGQDSSQHTWSNIAVGMARVVTALGESTIPDILPSHGQHDSKRYTCIKSPIPDVKILLSMHDT